MIAKGFRPVGWVAAVGAAALGCYMISLNVASSRAEVLALDRDIIQAKRDIRSLETELSTRGRLSQLEHWNADVLALSAPTSKQFVGDAVQLARFDRREATIEERAKVQLAAAETAAPKPAITAPVYQAAAVPAKHDPDPTLVHRAALIEPDLDKPVAEAPVRKASVLQGGLARDIDAAAKLEKAGESNGR